MRLLLLEALVWWQAEASPPMRRREVRLSRIWPLVTVTGILEVAVTLWITGWIKPLAPL